MYVEEVISGSMTVQNLMRENPPQSIQWGPAIGTILSVLIIGIFLGYVCERSRARRERRKYIQSKGAL